jgi:hypothetical protein
MQSVLRHAGIPAQKVTRKRRSGHYIANFYTPEMGVAVPSSREWERRLVASFPNQVEIVDRHDTVATWRQGTPTISASVTFRFR